MYTKVIILYIASFTFVQHQIREPADAAVTAYIVLYVLLYNGNTIVRTFYHSNPRTRASLST